MPTLGDAIVDSMLESRRSKALGDVEVPLAIPFLKWAGGKRWLAATLCERIGHVSGTYFEPFLGSAAVFFSLRPAKAILADSNADLIATYRAIQTKPKAIARHLHAHHLSHSKDHYYAVRSETPILPSQRAARFIYLNRTCWNGLYRVNLKGNFNVPIGSKTTVVLESDDFILVRSALKSASLIHADFQAAIAHAGEDDVVFCDPPYTVRHNQNGFIKYNEQLFSWSDQIRLRDSLIAARERGARVYSTNADHSSVRELYSDAFQIETVKRYSSIGGANAVRGIYPELLISA